MQVGDKAYHLVFGGGTIESVDYCLFDVDNPWIVISHDNNWNNKSSATLKVLKSSGWIF